MNFKFTREKAIRSQKAGVKMWTYSTKEDCRQGNVLYQEIEGLHDEEFVNNKSAFIYYIIKGKGEFIIEGEKYPVKATEVIIIPPGKRFYYSGKMKQILVVAPAWEKDSERVVRKVRP